MKVKPRPMVKGDMTLLDICRMRRCPFAVIATWLGVNEITAEALIRCWVNPSSDQRLRLAIILDCSMSEIDHAIFNQERRAYGFF